MVASSQRPATVSSRRSCVPNHARTPAAVRGHHRRTAGTAFALVERDATIHGAGGTPVPRKVPDRVGILGIDRVDIETERTAIGDGSTVPGALGAAQAVLRGDNRGRSAYRRLVPVRGKRRRCARQATASNIGLPTPPRRLGCALEGEHALGILVQQFERSGRRSAGALPASRRGCQYLDGRMFVTEGPAWIRIASVSRSARPPVP